MALFPVWLLFIFSSTVGELNPAPTAEELRIIEEAYASILGRSPMEEGFQAYVPALREGKDASWIKRELRRSPEARKLLRNRIEWGLVFILCLGGGMLAGGVMAGAGKRASASLRPRLRAGLLLLFVLLPPLLYLLLILRFSINFPYWDDFDAIVGFLVYRQFDTLEGFLRLHNEHRIALTRFLAWVSVTIRGTLELRDLIVVSWLALVGVFLLLVMSVDWRRERYLLSVVSLLVFAPVSWSFTVWAMASVQSLGALFFSFLAVFTFFRVTHQASRWVLTLLAAICAVLSSGSGLFVLPALGAALFWTSIRRVKGGTHSLPTRRDGFCLLGLGLLWSVFLYLYFQGYQRPDHGLGASESTASWIEMGRYLVTLAGSAVPLSAVSAAWVGFGSLLLLVALLFGASAKRNPVLLGMAFCLLAGMMAAAYSRTALGWETALADRYRIQSVLFLTVVFLLLFAEKKEFFSRFHPRVILMGLATLFFGLTFRGSVHQLENWRAKMEQSAIDWQSSGEGLPYPDHNQHGAAHRMNLLIRQGLYTLPEGLRLQPDSGETLEVDAPAR